MLCGLPWYIAIYARLGNEFFDRFVVHDMFNRAFAGVHGDTGTFRYFVGQLGYAMFPWTGLVPAALVGWRLYVPAQRDRAQKDVARLALLWFLVTFTLFSADGHQVPPLHLPGGPELRDSRRAVAAPDARGRRVALGKARRGRSRCSPRSAERPRLGSVGAALGAVRGRISPGAGASGLGAIALGAAALAMLASAQRLGDDTRDEATPSRAQTAWIGAVGLAAAVVTALVARDFGARASGSSRLVHLFTYQYTRPFPSQWFDYRAVLVGFALVAA